MAYERYPQGDYYGRSETQDYGQDYGSGRSGSYSSARDYEAAGEFGNEGRRGYGQRDYGNQRYAQRDAQYGRGNGGRDQGGRGYSTQDYSGNRDQGRGGYGQGSYGAGQQGGRYGQSTEYHGSYGSDGRRFEDVGRYRHSDDDRYNDPDARRRDAGRPQQGYGAQPQGYDYQDRGFFQRAGDEVRSWFGDEDAERRRDMDARYDERYDNSGDRGRDQGSRYGRHHDSDYHSWRAGQIAALDRDYDEYRQENRSKFENEFSTWRTGRQGQRDLLSKVSEHMDVVGSDDEHVGTVDKVRGDRILLTKNDADAGGRHHSFPSSWIKTVDGKVTLNKTAAQAKQQWQDEERNSAMFSYGDNADQSGRSTGAQASGQATSTSTAKTY